MKYNPVTRRTIIIVPFNVDVRKRKKNFVDSFANGGADVSGCHLTVVTCPEEFERANAFCDEIGQCFESRNVVVCSDAFSHMDCDTEQVCELAKLNDKELQDARDSYRAGQMTRASLSEVLRRWRINASEYQEACFKAGVFAAKLFREAIVSLWGWSEVDVSNAGFDPRDSFALLVSEDGTQVPCSPRFFQMLEFEASRDYTRFLVPYIYDAGDRIRGGYRFTAIGSIFARMTNLIEVFDGMQVSDRYNWREQLTAYFVDSYKQSDIMAREFGIKKDGGSKHVTKNDNKLASMTDISGNSSISSGHMDVNSHDMGGLVLNNSTIVRRGMEDSQDVSSNSGRATTNAVIKRRKKING